MTMSPLPNHPEQSTPNLQRSLANYIRLRLSPPFRLLIVFLLPIPLYFSTHLLDRRQLPPLLTCAPATAGTVTPPSSVPIPPILHSYITQHNSNYQCLLSPTCHRKPRLLIWQCPPNDPSSCAGVGDRFRGILFSLLLAITTNRTFLLSWPASPYPLHSALQPNHLNWPPPPSLLASLSSSPPPNLKWFRCERPRPCLFFGHMPNISHLPALVDSDPDINLYSDNLTKILAPHPVITISTRLEYTALPPFLANPNTVAALPTLKDLNMTTQLVPLLRQFMKALFRPSPEVAALMSMQQFRFSRSYFGIHARTGIDLAETADRRFQYVSKHVAECATKLLDCATERYGNKIPPRVYVAADSNEMKQTLKEEGEKRGVDVRFLEDKALHFGIHLSVMNKLEESDRCRRYLNVFVDLMMLTESNGMVVTGSGFANAAYLMGDMPPMGRLELGEGGQCDLGGSGVEMFEYGPDID
eukprot:GFKZ01011374.1.p1 GENE.GFKZ01011374.1~~GFKZ01011374.1.p1  ORF type:complete len:471 (+),score=46.04 GFKZ01011374.1:177-1589(+)